MKVLFQDYTFNAATKQITFNTTDNVALNQLLVITNVTDNIIIYNFADPLKGGVVANNVLTLTYDTTSMSNSDSIQIFLDLYGTPSTEETSIETNESVVLLRRLVQLLTPIGVQDAQQRQRVVVENGTIAVTTMNSLSAYANVDARFPIIDQARNTFANGIRQNLTY
jgi:hypothetical protein